MEEKGRSKKQLETELLSLRRQVAKLESLKAEHIRTGEVLLRLNRAHKAISTCNRALLQAKQETELLNDICRIIVEIGGYCFAWVGFVKPGKKRSVLPVAQAGYEEGYLSRINLSEPDNQPSRNPSTLAVRTAKSCMEKNIHENIDNAPWRTEAIKLGYNSLIAIPLIANGGMFGVLNIYAMEKDAFDMEEVKLLIKLADNLSYGIMGLRTQIERTQAMKALDLEKKRLRNLYDNSPDSIIILDKNFKVTYANQRTENITGIPLKEIVDKKCHQTIMGSSSACDGCMVGEVIKERKMKHRIKHEVTARGVENWIWQIWYPMLDHDGNVECVVEIARDVTEIKRAENALQNSEQRYRSLFEDSPTSLWNEDFSGVKKYIDQLKRKGVKDLRKYFEDNPGDVAHCVTLVKVVDVNKTTLKLYQAENKKDLLKGLGTIFGEEAYETFKEHLVAIAEGKTVFETEAVNRTLKGNQIYVIVKWSVTPGYEETLSKTTASVADITKRKLAEEALRRSEKRFRDVAKSTSDWIWEVDTQGRYTYCSKRIIKVLGYTADEILGKTPFDLMPPEEAVRAKKIFKKISENQDSIINMENWNISKEGCNICLLTNGRPMYDKQGRYIGYRGVDKDITERKLAEEALRDNARELKKHHEQLEKMVVERTAKLNKLNQQLRQEVAERKQAEGELTNHRRHLEELVGERTAELTRTNKRLQREITRRTQAKEELKYSLKRLRKIMGEIIDAMEYTVEMRDSSIAGHQRRVAELAGAIAQEMRLSAERIEGLRMAAAIHDIGKINVPVGILNKPCKLTEVEFGLVKTHSQVGYDIFKAIEFPQPVARIVLQHHERMNGSGYPAGLSGEDILVEARILGVADVIEAMCSRRLYRPASGISKALNEISKNKGALYDVEVADSALKLFLEKGFNFK